MVNLVEVERTEIDQAIETCLAVDRERLVKKRDSLIQAISRLDRVIFGGETARVAQSFHLGRVGGSGKNVKQLNRRREREMDKMLDAVGRREKIIAKLGSVQARIERIDDGSEFHAACEREARRNAKVERKASAPVDTIRRIRDEMSSGDHFYRFQDGAVMRCYHYWDGALEEPASIVVLVTPDRHFYVQQAKSVQGVHAGEAAVELAKKYLTARDSMVPAGMVLMEDY